MGATDILSMLEANGLTVRADGADLVVSPGHRITPEFAATIRENKADLLAEARRLRVLEMLDAMPGRVYAVYVADAANDPVTVTVGIRKGPSTITCDVEIQAAKYDGMALLELVERKTVELAVIPGGRS